MGQRQGNETDLKQTHVNIKYLSVRVFDGRVITLYPYVLHELRCKRVSASVIMAALEAVTLPVRQLFPTPPKAPLSSVVF